MRFAFRALLVLLAFARMGVASDHQADGVVIPVAGVTADQLRRDFNDWRARGSRRHHALDILAPRGTPVLAAVDGEVRKIHKSRGGGLTVYQTDEAGKTIYFYAHLDSYAAELSEGMPLCKGAVIGFVGTTGNAPRNTPHLHFAIAVLPHGRQWWKGKPLDPYLILKKRGVTLPAPSPPTRPSESD